MRIRKLSAKDALLIAKALKYKYGIKITEIIKINFADFYNNRKKGLKCDLATLNQIHYCIEALNEEYENLIELGRNISEGEKYIRTLPWNSIISGIKERLRLTNDYLAKGIGVDRATVGDWGRGVKNPNYKNFELICKFIKENNLNINDLVTIGSRTKNIRKGKFALQKITEDFAEIVGILAGDGTVSKSGLIDVTGSSVEEEAYHRSRIAKLFQSVFNRNVRSKITSSIIDSSFTSIDIARFLNSLGIPLGKKANLKMPKKIKVSRKLSTAYLRGLFDTDGTVCKRNSHNIRVCYGSFKEQSYADEILLCLREIGFNAAEAKHPSGRTAVCISNDLDVIRFFRKIGSSNFYKIARFLYWKLSGICPQKEYSMVKEKLKNEFDLEIEKLPLPFFWTKTYLSKMEKKSSILSDKLEEDTIKDKFADKISRINWQKLVSELKREFSLGELTKELSCNYKTIWQWENGTRVPKLKTAAKIIRFCNKNNITLANFYS